MKFRERWELSKCFIKCIVKAARVNKWDPRFYCGLKRYTLAVLFVEDLPLVHLSLICSESLCMCRKAFKIWHFFVKRLILNTGIALDFKNHANIFVWKCLDCYDYCEDVHTKVHGPSRDMSLCPLSWTFIYLDEWSFFCCVFAVGKSWTQLNVQRRSVCNRRPWSFIVGSSVLSFFLSVCLYCSVLSHTEM